jgi:hypothetical protein
MDFYIVCHGDTIKEGNKSSDQENVAMIFLRHYLHGDLKNEFLNGHSS